MDIQSHLKSASEKDVRAALNLILEAYLSPAFGALPKREVDLLIYNALVKIGYIEESPKLYSLVTNLRVTRSKARSLLYEQELRKLTTQELDRRILEFLKRPIIQKESELFLLEIENPLVIDHLRAKVQALGYASDGSFSPSLVRLSDAAVIALIDEMLDKHTKSAVKAQLVKAGFPDKSFKGILKDVLKAVGKKVADNVGSDVTERVLSPIIDGAFEIIPKVIAEYGISAAGNRPS
ncbi:MAG: hypothetical protein LC099_04260 [Anaerolineales bacterium]|nr:hypothetical protein [Anaerolineales bacterium]